MDYYPKTAIVPKGFSTPQFTIRPLLATDVQKDYEAVMAAQELNLRLTEGRWPKDGFSVEENLEDLKYHQIMHEERKEFTYTIMDPEEQNCLGCIYFYPPNIETTGGLKANNLSEDFVSIMYFWLRPDMTTNEFGRRFFDDIRGWIKAEWDFNNVYYHIRGNSTPDDRQIFLEVGMEEKFKVGKNIYFA